VNWVDHMDFDNTTSTVVAKVGVKVSGQMTACINSAGALGDG